MTTLSMGPGRAVRRVAVCGSGLAADVTLAALAAQLPAGVAITHVQCGDQAASDLFYGTVTGPTAYAFNLAAGLAEPRLVLDPSTAFSWGTRYEKWAQGSRSWLQGHQLALPVIDGVLFHHYVVEQGGDRLEPYLVSAMAARKGVFVHPPRKAPPPGQFHLSRAEYGYQIDPADYAAAFRASIAPGRVETAAAGLADVVVHGGAIAALQLDDGSTFEADFYIDCTGPAARLLTALGARIEAPRPLGIAASSTPGKLGPPHRTVTPAEFGWTSQTPLKDRTLRLSVFDPAAENAALLLHGEDALTAQHDTGTRDALWLGNCAAVGQAGYVLDPLTPAPIMLLERDVERLLALIPASADMGVERREYNRRGKEDVENALLFSQALAQTGGLPQTPYWAAAQAGASEQLERKLTLFEDRGFPVSYDLEPFHPEDWTILHFGMGRVPRRADPLAARAPKDKVRGYLSGIKAEIEKLVAGLPAHAQYMTELAAYLQRTGKSA